MAATFTLEVTPNKQRYSHGDVAVVTVRMVPQDDVITASVPNTNIPDVSVTVQAEAPSQLEPTVTETLFTGWTKTGYDAATQTFTFTRNSPF